MKSPDTPKVSRASALPLVWVVPLLALAIGGWMVVSEYLDHGPEITIEFADASGVEAGKTMLEYKGVTMGEVQDVELKKDDLKVVVVHVRLNKKDAALACEGAQIWIVHPQIDLSGVRGLETLVTGAFLEIRPGTGAPATEFQGIEEPPPVNNTDLGLAFILQSDRLGGITSGAPVYFREMKVGEVEASQLSDDSSKVLIRIRIYTPYRELVRTNTQFWNAGGLSMKMGLFGAQISSTSIESLVEGGVAFATPSGDLAPPAADGAQFTLNDDAPKDWLTWQPKISVHTPESTPASPVRGGTIPFVH
jgi:paraquat-inducible protein B